MKSLKFFLVLTASLMVFAACERDEMELEQAEVASAISEGEASAFFDDIDLMATEAIGQAENGRILVNSGYIPACASITHNADTRTTTIDFGSGCRDAKGNVRTGKIVISRAGGRYIESGSLHTTSLEGYSINDIRVEGTRTVTNITTPAAEYLQFSITLRGGNVSWPDGSFAAREVDHQRSWIRTSQPAADEWHITGSASGTNRAGQAYQSSVSEALVVKMSCFLEGVRVPVKGSVFVDRPQKPVIVINYGNGNCDSEATVSMNGLNRTITLDR